MSTCFMLSVYRYNERITVTQGSANYASPGAGGSILPAYMPAHTRSQPHAQVNCYQRFLPLHLL